VQFLVLLMMGVCDTRNMYSSFAVNKYLHTVASGWIFINTKFVHQDGCHYMRAVANKV